MDISNKWSCEHKKTKRRLSQIIADAFSFSLVPLAGVKKEMINLDAKRSSSSKWIPATILKQSVHMFIYPF